MAASDNLSPVQFAKHDRVHVGKGKTLWSVMDTDEGASTAHLVHIWSDGSEYPNHRYDEPQSNLRHAD